MYGVTNEDIQRVVSAMDYAEALSVTSTEKDVIAACEAGRKYGFRAVVAFPQFLGLLVDNLKDSGVLAQIPVGFPCGGQTTYVKCKEAEEGLERGANDLDMVMNLAAFQAGDYKRVMDDIQSVLRVARPFNVPFKVIIEVGLWSDEQIATAAKLVADSSADFVKTCTGFGPGRATIHNIGLIKATIQDRIKIKATGGMVAIEDCAALMKAGASVVAMRGYLVQQLESIDWKPQPKVMSEAR